MSSVEAGRAAAAGVAGAAAGAGVGDLPRVPCFKVAMLGASGVGKTTLTYQFTTSEYICAYDTSLGESACTNGRVAMITDYIACMC